MNVLKAVAAGWKVEADTVEQRYGDRRTARLLRRFAAELEEAIRTTEDETLTLAQASRASGYSKDHLRHLVSEGTIQNAGGKGRPRIRRRDLPSKPGALAEAVTDEAKQQAREILRARARTPRERVGRSS